MSPEQTALRLALENVLQISHETIYAHLRRQAPGHGQEPDRH